MTKWLACIYNPGSGRNATTQEQIKEAFVDQDVELDFFKITDGHDKVIKKLRGNRYDIVVSVGGDGTVNFSAGIAVELAMPLGVLAEGTLNHFAKDAGLPLKIEDAAACIAESKFTKVDYCTVNDKVFVNNSSIGIYPSTVLGRDDTHPLLGKWLATIVAFWAAVFRNHTMKLEVETSDDTFIIKTPLVFVGNNEYTVERAGFTKRGKLNTGKMFLFIVKESKSMALIRVAFLTLFGMIRRKTDTCDLTAGPVVLSSKRSNVNVSVDGEVVRLNFPLKYEIHAKGLSLCVPGVKMK